MITFAATEHRGEPNEDAFGTMHLDVPGANQAETKAEAAEFLVARRWNRVLVIALILLGGVWQSRATPDIVVAWGNNNDDNSVFAGEATPPLGLTNVATIAAGGDHSLALNNDGTVIGWGDNGYGQSSIPMGLCNVVGIAAGYYHSLAVKNDGTVVAWGSNISGETNVPTGLSNVVAVAAGGCDCLPNGNQSLALKGDGTVVGWGATTVPAGLSNVVAISAGDNHALALTRQGTIIGWGANYNGQATAPLGLSNVVAISAGGYHSMALQIDGTVTTWGNNYYGQTDTPSTLSNVVAIAAGENFSAALQSDGSVVVWGSNIAGESIVPAGLSNIVAITTGARHVLALENNGSPYVTRQPLNWAVYSGMSVNLNAGAVGPQPLHYQWQFSGTNIAGATNTSLALINLQTNNAGNYSVVISNPVSVVSSSNATVLVINSQPIIVNQPTNFVAQLDAPIAFGVSVAGSIPVSFQWQFNGTNISDATNSILNLPPWTSEGNYNVVISNAFGITTCSNATLTTLRSQIVPWGSNSSGQTNIPTGLGNVLAISAGGMNSMALKSDGTMAVWGDNSQYQSNVPAGLSNVVAIACGSFYDCLALKNDGTVIGWGLNGFGKATAPAGLSNVVAIAAGDNHTLALQSSGKVLAWGSNDSGQTNVPATLNDAVAIAAGSSHSLAQRGDGTVVAWGNNSSGQTNVPTTLTNVMAIAACANDSLALQSNGTVFAWGDNTFGQTNVPSSVTNVISIAAGLSYNLALRNDGTVVAWGNNTSGQTSVPVGLDKVIGIAAGQYHSLALLNGGPPLIAVQPLNQTNFAGFPIIFTANVLGLHPIAYQWQFNGTNIVGATNALMALANVLPTDAGNYSLIVTNSFGTTVSSNATLTVIVIPPTITLQPTNQTVIAGSNITFVAAVGPGPIPVTYQWQFNGTNIDTATNLSMTLIDVQPLNQGVYNIVVTNNFGEIASSNASLIVTGFPPSSATIQPPYQLFAAGSNISFTATANGSLPLHYQWQINGTNIIWATNSSLTLSNAQPTDEGIYNVVLTNYFGSITSSYALLSDLSTALDAPGLIWTNSGSAAWFPETSVTHDGIEAVQSGAVANNKSSILQTTVTGPGTLTFWWMFSPLTSPFPNTLSFLSSQGNASNSVNSTTGWQQKTFYLGTGQQTLTWNYSRSFFFGSQQSTGWVDQVSFTPGGTPPTIAFITPNAFVRANSSVFFNVGAYGTPPLAYQWQLNSTNLLDKTNSFLSLTSVQLTNAGLYSVVVTNNYGNTATNVTLWVGQFGLSTGSTNLFMATNGFHLELDGILTANPVVILESTDLMSWLPIYTNPPTTGSIQFLDFMATNLPMRFYRAQE